MFGFWVSQAKVLLMFVNHLMLVENEWAFVYIFFHCNETIVDNLVDNAFP